MTPTLNVATRKSRLALAQTKMACALLQEHFVGMGFVPMHLVTTGDRQADWILSDAGGKGLFTKELEEALLDGRAALAVHSAKDLPTEMPEGLALAGFMRRERPNDVFVCREDLEKPKVIATGSPRRRNQGKRLFPEAEWVELRGNVETRLRKIVEGEADATFLAAAGLRRLGIAEWEGLRFEELDVEVMVPAPGQGAIALQCRADEAERWRKVLDESTWEAVTIERSILGAMGGGCHSSLAVHCSGGRVFVYADRSGVTVYERTDFASVEALQDAVVNDLQA